MAEISPDGICEKFPEFLKFFAEDACYCSEKEKEEAKLYLELWKKFLIKKLNKEFLYVTVFDQEWSERNEDSLCQTTRISLRICVKANSQIKSGKNR